MVHQGKRENFAFGGVKVARINFKLEERLKAFLIRSELCGNTNKAIVRKEGTTPPVNEYFAEEIFVNVRNRN